MSDQDKSTGRTFRIHTVADLLEVPADRLSDCFHELRQWVAMHKLARIVGLKAQEGKGGTDAFVWHDDGKGEIKVTVNFHASPATEPDTPPEAP